MNKIVVVTWIVIALILTACGGTTMNDTTSQAVAMDTHSTEASIIEESSEVGELSQDVNGNGYEIIDRPQGKLPTIVLYNKDGVKLTLSEPEPDLLQDVTFERAGKLTLENNKENTVGVSYAELYVNRIETAEDSIGLVAEPGEKMCRFWI